jgi:hypothetical protein
MQELWTELYLQGEPTPEGRRMLLRTELHVRCSLLVPRALWLCHAARQVRA